jgi:hypothetical protein
MRWPAAKGLDRPTGLCRIDRDHVWVDDGDALARQLGLVLAERIRESV